MGLLHRVKDKFCFKRFQDFLNPHHEVADETLRDNIRKQVHAFRNQAMNEVAVQKEVQGQINELSKNTRRLIKRLEIAKERQRRQDEQDDVSSHNT
jgi:hypothetical protein